VTSMSRMFYSASSFNQILSTWAEKTDGIDKSNMFTLSSCPLKDTNLSLDDAYLVQYQANLDYIVDQNNLKNIFNTINKEVEMKTWDGSWVSTVHLPHGSSVPVGSKFQVTCGSTWSIKMHYQNGDGSWRTKFVYTNQNLVFVVVNGVWLTEYDPMPRICSFPSDVPTESPSDNPTTSPCDSSFWCFWWCC